MKTNRKLAYIQLLDEHGHVLTETAVFRGGSTTSIGPRIEVEKGLTQLGMKWSSPDGFGILIDLTGQREVVKRQLQTEIDTLKAECARLRAAID